MNKGERGVAIQEGSHAPEGRLMVSPDVVVLEDVLVIRGRPAHVKVQLTPESLLGLPTERASELLVSPRSRYAQGFLDIEDAPEAIDEHLRSEGVTSLEGLDPERLQPRIKLVNYAMRDHVIRKGARLFRFFYHGGRHLTGNELLNSAVRIDDEPIREDMVKKEQGKSVALRLNLDPETRKWVLPSNQPLEIDPHTVSPRDQLNEVLMPAPVTDEVIPYQVFSREKLTMPEGYYGLVRSYGYANGNGKETQYSVSVHGRSQFLDPKREWKIVFELRGRTNPTAVANYMDVDVFAYSK